MENNENKEITLVESTQKRILEHLAKDGYYSNAPLPKESELAEILGVSRVVVREALSSLRALGFLETKRKKGTVFVYPRLFGSLEAIINSKALDKEAVRDLYELRLMLEIGSADFIFERKDEKRMKKLLSLVEEEEICQDYRRLVEIDIEFHSTLHEMANSRSISDFHTLIRNIFTVYPLRPKNWRRIEIMSHRGIYGILENGTADLLRAAIRMHLTYQFENEDRYIDAYNANQSSEDYIDDNFWHQS